MWFDLAGTRTVAQTCQAFEHSDTYEGGSSGSANRGNLLCAAKCKKNKGQVLPQPAVAHSRCSQHPITDPTRRPPAIHSPHDAMIAALNESPNMTCDGHGVLRLAARPAAPIQAA